jgi:hypothetical protein
LSHSSGFDLCGLAEKLDIMIMKCKSYALHTVTVGLKPEAEEVAEPVVDNVDELVPAAVEEELLDVDVDVAVVAAVDELVELGVVMLDNVEPLELELVTGVLVGALVAVPPQIMFIDTARGVAYIVGLAPELAADEA